MQFGRRMYRGLETYLFYTQKAWQVRLYTIDLVICSVRMVGLYVCMVIVSLYSNPGTQVQQGTFIMHVRLGLFIGRSRGFPIGCFIWEMQ